MYIYIYIYFFFFKIPKKNQISQIFPKKKKKKKGEEKEKISNEKVFGLGPLGL